MTTNDDAAAKPLLSKTWRGKLKLAVRFLRRRLFLTELSNEEAQEVRQSVEAEAVLSERYILMSGLSAGIAILGLLQSSTAVVIGAMLVSPLMGPIAALGFGFSSFEGTRIRTAVKILGVGAAIGIGVAILVTLASPVRNPTPELLARTTPTLLDLAVALLSGIAGAYATVHRRGETAIGVAIATALMPPLTTVGYGIAVLRFDFAAGAGLLFLTNLAAISLAFAVIARLRGVARPFSRVDFKPHHVLMASVAALTLLVPLGLTLRKVVVEGYAARETRSAVQTLFADRACEIAKLDANWTLAKNPNVDVRVIVNSYMPNAEAALRAELAGRLPDSPQITLRQIVAEDASARAAALVESALNRTKHVVPPSLEAIRSSVRLPTTGLWWDQEKSQVAVSVAALDAIDLRAVRDEEARLANSEPNQEIILIPPFQPRTYVKTGPSVDDEAYTAQTDDLVWALRRWNVQNVRLEADAGRGSVAETRSAEDALARIAQALVASDVIAKASIPVSNGKTRKPGEDLLVAIIPTGPERPADRPPSPPQL